MIHVYPDPNDAAISTIDTNVDTLVTNVAAIKADTDAYLDAAVSSKASQSSVDTIDANVDTLVTNVAAIKSDTDAYLDAAVSSVAIKPQASFARDTAVDSATIGLAGSTQHMGAQLDAPSTMNAGQYYELISITAPGWLYVVTTVRNTSFSSGTLSTRITTDGDVWDVITDSASTTNGAGHVAHGMLHGGVISPIAVRFSASMKIEIASSVAQSGGSRAHSKVLYSLDT